MITYYVIGNWMGAFRTVSTTESFENFKIYCEIWKFKRNADGVFQSGTSYLKIEAGEEILKANEY